jgi:predicted PurR-regulated permease PerM
MQFLLIVCMVAGYLFFGIPGIFLGIVVGLALYILSLILNAEFFPPFKKIIYMTELNMTRQ